MKNTNKPKNITCRIVNTGVVMHINTINEIVFPGYFKIDACNVTAADGFPEAIDGTCLSAYLEVSDTNHNTDNLNSAATGQTLILSVTNGNTLMYTRSLCSGVWSEWEKSPTAADLANIEERLQNNNAQTIKWGATSNINTYVTAGIYNITGERLNTVDGLPIANSNPGHTIHARLVVLDSSINGAGDSDDKCVTQLLTLSNRTGGDGELYVRTGRSASKNQLVGGIGWEPWGKLQQNIEVGQVTSLDSYIGNGIYSGVYTDGRSFFETFVMVVINNYAVAGATGNVRSISQFKYALGVDRSFSYKTRTGQGNTSIEWGEWVDLGAAATTDIQDGAVTAEKLSSDIRPNVVNPLRPLFLAAGAEYNDSGADITKTAPWGETVTHKAGHYYLNGLGDITEEQMMAIYNAPHNALYEQAYFDSGSRTLLFKGNSQSTSFSQSLDALFRDSINLEVLGSGKEVIYFRQDNRTIKNLFKGCSNLRCISMIFYAQGIVLDNSVFSGCHLLENIQISRLTASLSLADSANISKTSILYVVDKALPSSAITITLHPNAYARLVDDSNIVAALEAQPLISLVSA